MILFILVTMGGRCGSGCQCFCEYSTSKVLVIRSKLAGVLNRSIQVLVIAFVVLYVCLYQKGYQKTDNVLSSVTTKVKGIALINTSELGQRIWDVADYVIPPQEDGSFFVLTNMIITPNQTQSKCALNPSSKSMCTSNQDCKRGVIFGNGVQTGICVHYSASEKTCEVLSWCPLEKIVDPPNPPLLANAENFTVLIKNSIRYPKFNFNKRNILPSINSSYLARCVFNDKTDPNCPIFRLKDIVTKAGEDFQTMAVHGGLIEVQIRWDCDLDWSEHWCVPRYTFQRVDKDPVHNVSVGYNFRWDKAGKFDILPTFLNIGAGLALLGVVSVIFDLIVLKCMKRSQHYKEQKYSYLVDHELLSNEEDT
ncbi:hypothetical protein DNTS_034541 [Danionella cerebrum]|uniref:P2X purinoceptor n=2 Tax=Danionella cerebrum TaxID=2873325 RepID=A0A553QF44_9TELE|nr:hypothetical protein DNTS_034541 [Danionella translucida]